MLRLERVFGVVEDVLPALPPLPPSQGDAEHDEVPHVSDEARQALLLKERNVTIIGQERGGVLLFAWDGYGRDPQQPTAEKITFVEMLELSTRKCTLLYTHHSLANVVHASVNQDRNLLVFTIYQRYQVPLDATTVEGEFQDIYETCMAEIQPQSRVFSLGSPSRKFQRVQFLPIHVDPSQRMRTQRALYYMLFIVHQEYIHAYSLPMAYIKATSNAKSGWRITEQPRKEYQVAKRFLWFQWDMPTQTLYYVYVKPNPKEQVHKPDFMLRGVVFAEEGKSDVFLDGPVPIKVPSQSTTEPEYLQLPCSRAVPDVRFHMEVLRTDANTLVACFQTIEEASGRISQSLQVTVVLLQRMHKLEFVIPLNNFPPNVVSLTRVAFTTLNHMLLIYLPGHYLQLVDCSSEHEPCPSLYFSGSELVTPFPDHVEGTGDLIGFGYTTHMELFANDTSALGFALYDCQFGRAYRYTFAEEAILNFFSRSVPQIAHVQSLHLAAVHMPDPSIALKAMQQMCSSAQSQFATPEVIKEYLVSMTYVEMRAKLLADAVNAPVLRFIPVTTIAPFGTSAGGTADEVGYASPDERRTSFGRSPSLADDLNNRSSLSLQGRTPRFSAEIALSATLSSPSPISLVAGTILNATAMASPQSQTNLLTGPNQQIGVRKGALSSFFGRLLGPILSDASTPSKQKGTSFSQTSLGGSSSGIGDEEEEDLLHRQRLVDALTEFLYANMTKEHRARCNGWAKDYAACQHNQATRLWNVMEDTIKKLPSVAELRERGLKPTSDHMSMFKLLESFYCAIEELHFPFPDGFHTKFAVLGFHCLPRHVFLQYLDRGIFRTTDSFIDHVLKIVGATSTDPLDYHFKMQLVSKMRNKKAVRVLRKLPEHERLMSQMMIQGLINDAEASDEEDMETDSQVVMNLDGLVAASDTNGTAEFQFIPLNVFAQYLRTKSLSHDQVVQLLSLHPLELS